MPIVLNTTDGTFVLRCVNYHATTGSEITTMRALDASLSVPAVQKIPNLEWNVKLHTDVVLRAYHCHVCGYVEFYMPKGGSPPEPAHG